MPRCHPPIPSYVVSPGDAIDLQMHTVYSDGAWRPAELLDYLAEHHFRVVAITDHDTLEHTDELAAMGAARGVIVVPAVEVTTRWGEYWADLLCFAPVDTGLAGNALRELVGRTHAGQLANTQAVHAELGRRGYAFPEQEIVLASQGGQLVRPVDNARLLLHHGYAASQHDAIQMIRAAGFRSITARLQDAVAAAHASGAIAILAHPGRQEAEISRFEPALIAEMLHTIPLDGIEVYYPLHTPEQVAAYAEFAEQRGLLRSAGSDSHGTAHRLPIAYRAELCQALLARCGIDVAPTA